MKWLDMNTKISLTLIGFLLFIALNAQDRLPTFNYKQLSKADNWQISCLDSTSHSGHMRLSSRKWLMHFLHWWPLTHENKDISVEHATRLLQSLWGMQFTLTGKSGKCEVNGHPAYYVEGQLGEAVKTRFIIWKCSQTNRQFLSDCNINIALKTPEDLLNLQAKEITNSIQCHGKANRTAINKLPKAVIYDSLSISFRLPGNWHSDLFIVNDSSEKEAPGHFKHGVNENNGVIWNLLTNSEKQADLIWRRNNEPLTEGKFKKLLLELFQDTSLGFQNNLQFYSYFQNIETFEINSSDECLYAEGGYDKVSGVAGQAPMDTSHYKMKAFCWKVDDFEYYMIASMVAHNNFWGIPVDLYPSEKEFDSFLKTITAKIANIPCIDKF